VLREKQARVYDVDGLGAFGVRRPGQGSKLFASSCMGRFRTLAVLPEQVSISETEE